MTTAASAPMRKPPLPLSLATEVVQVVGASVKSSIRLPIRFTKALFSDPRIDGPTSEQRFFDLLGDALMGWMDGLGPIYGKAGQVALSRLPANLQSFSETLRLTRLYGDWPQMDFSEVKVILDKEIPHWRSNLNVCAHPLGVASMAQVHAAQATDGSEWVLKVLKPDACRRLQQSLQALEGLVSFFRPIAVTLTTKRALDELQDLAAGFRQEMSLNRERQTINKVRGKIVGKRQQVLRIPEVFDELSNDKVMVIERFQGIRLADVVRGKAKIDKSQRRKLARHMLQELLIQVFELGLFHADPHAGNLILLNDGTVGLFDWGLAGELTQKERQQIATILKAVVTLDADRLIDALVDMGADQGVSVSRQQVKKELMALVRLIRKAKESPPKDRPSLYQMFEACLKAAEKVKIRPPNGLLLMVKSLITVEGLAKGIDPEISMLRVAGPILLKASKPSMKDWVQMLKKLPKIRNQVF